jgi:hypothetical protein
MSLNNLPEVDELRNRYMSDKSYKVWIIIYGILTGLNAYGAIKNFLEGDMFFLFGLAIVAYLIWRMYDLLDEWQRKTVFFGRDA